MHRRMYLYLAIFFLVIFGLFFFYEKYRIPEISASLTEREMTKVAFVVSDIPKGTIITEEMLYDKDTIIYKKVDIDNIYNEPLVEIEKLLGRKVTMDIPAGVYLIDDFFVGDEKKINKGKVLYAFPVSNHNSVARKVRPGDVVAVRVRYSDPSPSEVVVPSIVIEDITDSAGVSVLESESQSLDWAVVWVTEEELALLEEARKNELFMTLY
ncbi:MAG: hypothetical protein APF76_04865 [Desulfitibacter sp. BRH_c19]|nr:MAG: hypothetical protein APF76_04865 [Desulfitibacter sp. BRH_c19]